MSISMKSNLSYPKKNKFLANGEKLDIQEQIKKLQQARFPRTSQFSEFIRKMKSG